jgi:short-subunit dehydrogenase
VADPTADGLALVTGASRGIGRAIALEIASRQRGVVLVARTSDRLETVASEIEARYSVETHVLAVDLSDRAASERIASFLETNQLFVHTLVNNAGYGLFGEFSQLDLQEQLDMIQVNLMTLTELTHRLLPPMIERRTGVVLNVGSTAGFQPAPLMALYHATKAYVLYFTEALAEELRGTGVSATALCPGPVKTEFRTKMGVEEKIPWIRWVQVDVDKVARIALNAAERGTVVVVPGFLSGLGSLLAPRLPRALVRKTAHLIQRQRL